MTKTETIAAINALPVSDTVKAHAVRLIEGLPEWCPMPDDHGLLKNTGRAYLEWWGSSFESRLWRRLTITIDNDGGAPVFAYEFKIDLSRYSSRGGPITDRDVHELIRQLTGMVAITGGG